MHQTAIALLAVAFVQPPQVRYSSWHSAAASFCCSSPRFTLSKIFSRSRSFALIFKCPSICPPFRVRHRRGLFYSVSQRAVLSSHDSLPPSTLTSHPSQSYLWHALNELPPPVALTSWQTLLRSIIAP